MTTDILFVPDSNIIYPSIFLANIEKIGPRACRCRDCFDLLKKSHNYVILPANKTDFSNLIIKKFGKFLGAIELEITQARKNNSTERAFYAATLRRLQSYGLDKDDKDFGNLTLFWFSHKELFWSFVSKDEMLTKTRMTMMTLEKIGEYAKVCEGHEETFSENEQNLGEKLYSIIKKARNDNKFGVFANDADLLILAQCFIYRNMRYDGFSVFAY